MSTSNALAPAEGSANASRRPVCVSGSRSGSVLRSGLPQCRIVYDKFHIIQHANDAVDEVRAEQCSSAKGGRCAMSSKEKVVAAEPLEEPGQEPTRPAEPGIPSGIGALFKAYLLKESLEKLWDYRYERNAMLNYLHKWIDQLRWQRLPSFQKLAEMLLKTPQRDSKLRPDKVRFGVVEAINGNIRMLINRGRGYKNMRYLLLKARRMAVNQHRIRRFSEDQESRVECHFLRIPAESRKSKVDKMDTARSNSKVTAETGHTSKRDRRTGGRLLM